MMRAGTRFALGSFAILLAIQQAAAQSTEYQLAQIVSERQALMFDLQSAYWVLLKVHDGKSSDFAGAADAARNMSDTMERFRPLMQPGTARGESPGSRARPEAWSEADAFEAVVNNFQTKAVSLSEVAARGNKDEYAMEFEAFSVACTSCHGLRPSSGGRFRYAINE